VSRANTLPAHHTILSEEKEKIVSANEDRQRNGPTDIRAYQSIQLWMDVVNKMYHLSEEEDRLHAPSQALCEDTYGQSHPGP